MNPLAYIAFDNDVLYLLLVVLAVILIIFFARRA